MANNKRPWSPPQMIWSAIIGIAVWSAVGFSWFGHGFDWTTQVGARRMSTDILVEQLASICVAQAQSSPNATEAIEKLATVNDWKRREFIDSEEWAIMPGSKKAESGVADLCAAKLLAT
jgi:hypothetical protein